MKKLLLILTMLGCSLFADIPEPCKSIKVLFHNLCTQKKALSHEILRTYDQKFSYLFKQSEIYGDYPHRNHIYFARKKFKKKVKARIALTYANDIMMDGLGAQLQRIYGIYALSRFYNVPYIHSPLKEVEYQGLLALEKNSNSGDIRDKYNQIFTIPSDIKLPKNAITRYLETPKPSDIKHLIKEAQKKNEFYLVRILGPQSITDKNPEIYRPLKALSPFPCIPSDTFRVAIHVRRGDLFVVDSDRMLPNSYYISSTMKIVEALETLDIPFVCELYTEVPSKAFVVTPQHPGICGRIDHPIAIDPEMNHLEDFDVIPNLHLYVNLDPVETLNRMTTSDTLIMSRSSFSYMSALFSQGIIIYHPFWHSPLKEWLVSDINGNMSSERLIEQLESWKRLHCNLPTAPSD